MRTKGEKYELIDKTIVLAVSGLFVGCIFSMMVSGSSGPLTISSFSKC